MPEVIVDKEQRAHLLTPSGQPVTVPVDKTAEAMAAGYLPESREAYDQRQLVKERSTPGQLALTGAEAAARGATLGLSDVATTALLGEGYREAAQERREASPTLSTVGEILGALAPTIPGVGATGLARTVGAPARLLSRAGEATALGLERAGVAASKGILRHAVAKGVQLGAAGAVEGGLYGAGQALSEATLENTPVTVEKLLAGAATGAEFGAAGGMVLGALGGGLGGALKGAKLKERAAKIYGTSAFKAAGGKGADATKLAAKKGVKAAEAERQGIGDFLTEYELKSGPRAGQKILRNMAKADDIAGDVERARREIGDDLGKMREEIDEALGSVPRGPQEVAAPVVNWPKELEQARVAVRGNADDVATQAANTFGEATPSVDDLKAAFTRGGKTSELSVRPYSDGLEVMARSGTGTETWRFSPNRAKGGVRAIRTSSSGDAVGLNAELVDAVRRWGVNSIEIGEELSGKQLQGWLRAGGTLPQSQRNVLAQDWVKFNATRGVDWDQLPKMRSMSARQIAEAPGADDFFSPRRVGGAKKPVAEAVVTPGEPDIGDRVFGAYETLRQKTQSPHVVISDLADVAGVQPERLKKFLFEEMKAGRADPARGEPTLASKKQLDAAVSLDNEPHLYIQLLERRPGGATKGVAGAEAPTVEAAEAPVSEAVIAPSASGVRISLEPEPIVSRVARTEAAVTAHPRADEVLQRIEKEVLDPLREVESATNVRKLQQIEGELRELRRVVDDAGGKAAYMSFGQLERVRRSIADVVYPKPARWNLAPPVPESMWDLRNAERIINNYLDESAEKAFRATGKDPIRYTKAKSDYHFARAANELSRHTSTHELGLRMFSPSDMGIGVGYGLMHAASGNPAPLLFGIGAAIANKVLRERGRSTMALLAKRAMKVDEKLDDAAFKMVSGAARRTAAAGAVIGVEALDYSELTANVRAATTDPEALQGVLAAASYGVEQDQQLASNIHGLIRGDLEYLRRNLPGGSSARFTLTPNAVKPQVPLYEQKEFLRRFFALERPDQAIEDLASGKINPEVVDALKERRPEIFRELRERVMAYAAQRDEELPYGRSIVLGSLFDFASDPSLQPQILASIAEIHTAAKTENQQPGPAAAGKMKGELADQMKTTTTDIGVLQ
jgi:hypothetical protein